MALDLSSIISGKQGAQALFVVSGEDLAKFAEDIKKFCIATIKERDEPEYYTREELAEVLHVSLVTLGRWRENGLLPEPVKMDGRVLFDKAKVRDMIESSYTLKRKMKVRK